jgi:hypothetical protein
MMIGDIGLWNILDFLLGCFMRCGTLGLQESFSEEFSFDPIEKQQFSIFHKHVGLGASYRMAETMNNDAISYLSKLYSIISVPKSQFYDQDSARYCSISQRRSSEEYSSRPTMEESRESKPDQGGNLLAFCLSQRLLDLRHLHPYKRTCLTAGILTTHHSIRPRILGILPPVSTRTSFLNPLPVLFLKTKLAKTPIMKVIQCFFTQISSSSRLLIKYSRDDNSQIHCLRRNGKFRSDGNTHF